MVIFGGACGIEVRKILFPETPSPPETSQYEIGTINKGDLRDCRISEDKGHTRSSGLFIVQGSSRVEQRHQPE